MSGPPRLPFTEAMVALARCAASTGRLLARRAVHLPTRHVDRRLTFGDGSVATVYRETVVDRPEPSDPCLLVVEFRLRRVRGWGHRLFRWESVLNTPLFVGFPGFASKLWLTHDPNGYYRGLYEWDGAGRAEAYVRALWWALIVVCEKDSIHHRIVPGVRRDAVLDQPGALEQPGALGRPGAPLAAEWWNLVGVN